MKFKIFLFIIKFLSLESLKISQLERFEFIYVLKMTKIIFFDVKSYNKVYLEPYSAQITSLPRFKDENKPEIIFLSTKLNSETIGLAKDADIVSLFVHDKIDAEMLTKLKNLRMIACRSAGFDYVDLKECAQRGIKVTNVPSYSPNSIAEFTVGLMIDLARNLRMALDRSRHGDFKLTPKLLGFESKWEWVFFK